MPIEIYMSEQAQVIENALNHESIAAAVGNIPNFDRVILIGSGSSLNALTIVRAFLQAKPANPPRSSIPPSFSRRSTTSTGSRSSSFFHKAERASDIRRSASRRHKRGGGTAS